MTSDIIVIGGGAAGMMAALAAADRGRSVLLLERNAKVGWKLVHHREGAVQRRQ